MSSFTKALTNKGIALQAKAQTGVELKFTRFVIGDGKLNGQAMSALTNVINAKKTMPITKRKMEFPNQATIGFVLSNQDVTTGFYFRELGLYANDPDEGEILYLYANAGDTADYIPAAGGSNIIEESFDVLAFVGQAPNVSANINNSLVYVTHPELEEALSNIDFDVIDSTTSTDKTKAPSADALRRGLEAMGGWKTYNDITELGLTAGAETIDAIVRSMPDKSELRFMKITSNTSAAYPATAGILHIRRHREYRVELSFIQGGSEYARKWFGYWDVNVTPNFTGWQEIAVKKYVDDNFAKPSQIQTPNLIKNSSGHLGLQGWTPSGDSPSAWRTENNISSIGGHFQISASIPTGFGSYLDSDPIHVSAGSNYQLQAMFHTSGTTSERVSVEIINVDKTTTYGKIDADLNKWWHRKVGTFQIPTGVSQIRIRLTVAGTANTQVKAFSRIKLAFIHGGALDTPYSNESDIASISNWQRHKVTADNGTVLQISSGNDLNNLVTTGMYNGSNLVNAPTATSAGDWYYVEVLSHTNSTDYVMQRATKLNGSSTPTLYVRIKHAGTWGAWSQDVFQSGVDAKQGTVDAINAMGGSASTSDIWSTLHTKIRGLYTGKKYVESGEDLYMLSKSNWNTWTQVLNRSTSITFRPTLLILKIRFKSAYYSDGSGGAMNYDYAVLISNSGSSYYYKDIATSIRFRANFTDTGFTLERYIEYTGNYSSTGDFLVNGWIAIA
ncbi:phage tail protein [Paenibacillus provencensis]|uniref:Phage tail protein n=1 Tax=Paenibacillus provencensis TaxID=441151 RepID=A0ABW3PKK0_9BACL|nr:phage tail protein [Paenibacillus sp. MER 78]MCM3129027.1 phage tail protein [Paenibacillus sp. MER 78]